MSQHVFRGSGAPATTPTVVGQHYIDTLNGVSYISTGTSSSADWKAGVTGNVAITPATKTKITYDAKGLVTAGADIAAADLPTGIDAIKIGAGSVSNTEFGFLDGVTSAIQTQIDGKVTANGAISGATKTKITYDAKGLVTAGADIAAADLPTGIDAAKIANASVSNTEFQFLDGVTSAIQTQINAKKTDSMTTARLLGRTTASTGAIEELTVGLGLTLASGSLSSSPKTPVSISSTAIDWSLGDDFYKTLAANTTFTFSNTTDGQIITVELLNTASNYTVTWPTVKWVGGLAPTQTVGAKTDIYTFKKRGSNIFGTVVQNFF